MERNTLKPAFDRFVYAAIASTIFIGLIGSCATFGLVWSTVSELVANRPGLALVYAALAAMVAAVTPFAAIYAIRFLGGRVK